MSFSLRRQALGLVRQLWGTQASFSVPLSPESRATILVSAALPVLPGPTAQPCNHPEPLGCPCSQLCLLPWACPPGPPFQKGGESHSHADPGSRRPVWCISSLLSSQECCSHSEIWELILGVFWEKRFFPVPSA